MLGPILAAVLAQAGPSTSYQVIQEEGGDLPRRVTVNFVGPGITCVDTKVSAMNFKTTCTVSATTDCTDDCAFTGTTTHETLTASGSVTTGLFFVSTNTGLGMTFSSGMTAASANSTTGAYKFIPSLALDANDLVLEVWGNAVDAFTVDYEGDGVFAATMTAAGVRTSTTLASTGTSITGLWSSATSAATASSTVGAFTLQPTALDANDLVLDVQSSAGSHLFTVDQEGDAAVAGLTITGALDIQSTISKSNGTTITVSEHLTSTGDITANGSDFGNGTTAPLVITGGDNDDGSAIGVRINTTNSLTTAGGQIATLENQSAVKAAISRRGAYQFVATDALDTCSETTVGTLARDGISGTDSYSDETHLCFCMGDGNSPVAYFWRNVITGVVGTTTTCTP